MTRALATIFLGFLERREHALYNEAEKLRNRLNKTNEDREAVRKQIAPLRDALAEYDRADNGQTLAIAEHRLYEAVAAVSASVKAA